MNVVFLQFSGNIRCFGSAIKFDHTRVIWNARGLELVKKKSRLCENLQCLTEWSMLHFLHH